MYSKYGKTTITCLLLNLLLVTVGSGQIESVSLNIKPLKDTLFPFDILEFQVNFKALKRIVALPFNKSSLIQLRMEEPRQSQWFLYSGLEVNFGGFTSDDDSKEKKVIPDGFLSTYRFAVELSPDTSLARHGPIYPMSLAPGKYSMRIVYSPGKLLFEQIGFPANIDDCMDCLMTMVDIVVLDHYTGVDQPAFEWLKKIKCPNCFYMENCLFYTNEEYIAIGEEFLNLFPESCFAPYVHCKIGDSLRRIYEEGTNKDKASPEETIKKMQDIIMHLGYYKQTRGHDRLYIYYEEMREKFQNRLARFKAKHGIK